MGYLSFKFTKLAVMKKLTAKVFGALSISPLSIDTYSAVVVPDADTDIFALTGASTYLANGEIVRFTAETALPDGLTADTDYYVINVSTSGFKVSATSGGSAVNMADTGTGDITVIKKTITIDWSESNYAEIDLDACVGQVVMGTDPEMPCELMVKINQDSTGSRDITSWGSSVVWAGGSAPALTNTASKSDIVRFFYDGTKYYGSVIANY